MTQTQATDMHFLFDVDLRHQDFAVAMARPDGAGDLVGSGTGQIDGPHLRGKLRWSNFERSQPDHCQLTVVGEIDTEDGAAIHFDSRGFALPPRTGTEWKIVAAVRFVVNDARY